MDERFVIIRLLEMDEEFEAASGTADQSFLEFVRAERRSLAEMHDWPESGVFSSHRHAVVFDLFEKVSTVKPVTRLSLLERVDQFIINPLGGLITVVGILFLMFSSAFLLGDFISGIIEGPLDHAGRIIRGMTGGLTAVVISGLYDGVVSGVGIVLPYLVPLLLLMALLEDSGLLPRIAFMVDGILHRFGMHGKSVVPLILGYGCNVPAIMALRGLEHGRDRTLTMLIIPFISCSARTMVVLALVGKYLGGLAATLIFVGNIAVALMVSFFLSSFSVDTGPGIIMDVPPLRLPYVRIVARKLWARLYDFFVFAWPVIVVSA
jgi:ferrous iron transport protein B